MTLGAVIAVAFWGLVALLAGYAFSFDVRRWIDGRLWARDERRLSALLPSQTVEDMRARERDDRLRCVRLAVLEWERVELERLRSGVALFEAFALTRAEIESLPETPVRRSTWS